MTRTDTLSAEGRSFSIAPQTTKIGGNEIDSSEESDVKMFNTMF